MGFLGIFMGFPKDFIGISWGFPRDFNGDFNGDFKGISMVMYRALMVMIGDSMVIFHGDLTHNLG
jgi:hypothetical protein